MKNKKQKPILLASACAVFVPQLAACSQTQETPDPVPESNVPLRRLLHRGGRPSPWTAWRRKLFRACRWKGWSKSRA